MFGAAAEQQLCAGVDAPAGQHHGVGAELDDSRCDSGAQRQQAAAFAVARPADVAVAVCLGDILGREKHRQGIYSAKHSDGFSMQLMPSVVASLR